MTSKTRAGSAAFDYLIVGAGSAGCVLANRLTSDGRTTVLLIEAGPRDTNPWIKIPAGMGRLFTNEHVNWRYQSQPEPYLNDRTVFMPRGKVLGGSSSINGHVYMRGVAADYDAWAQMGNTGWDWQGVRPYFLKHEAHYAGSSEHHRGEGELHVSPLDEPHPISEDFVASAQALGVPRNQDFNGSSQEGVGYLEFNLKNGQRCSAATAFLNPVKSRKNLTIVTGKLVEKIRFQGKRAIGVTYRDDRSGGQGIEVDAGEVILSGGAVNSPQLLLLSGIGPGKDLAEHGIQLVADSPGVGQNLHDHIYVHCMAHVDRHSSVNHIVSSNLRLIPEVLRYLLTRRGLLLTAAAQVGVFLRSGPKAKSPDMQIQFRPFSMAVSPDGKFAMEKDPVVTASCSCIQPRSRGRLWLRSADPTEPPNMVANFLSDPADCAAMVEGLRWIRRIYQADPVARRVTGERTPGLEYDTDEALLGYIRQNAQSMYHLVGTCRMGTDDGAVVWPDLRVRGVEGLRVVDASVMPSIPSGNTNAPTLMIAEKAAAIIGEEQAR